MKNAVVPFKLAPLNVTGEPLMGLKSLTKGAPSVITVKLLKLCTWVLPTVMLMRFAPRGVPAATLHWTKALLLKKKPVAVVPLNFTVVVVWVKPLPVMFIEVASPGEP